MTINVDKFLEAGEIGGLATRTVETFTPSPAQTVFNLAMVPTVPNDTQFFVNNVKYLLTTDFTVVGSVVTWLDTEFALDSADSVEIIYFV